jgi:DNA-binding MarR family transcriptional regulator
MLLAAGTFRSVMTRDVERFIYAGNAAALRRDLANLEAQGLVERRIPDGTRARHPEVLSLTPAARALLEAARPLDQIPPQRFYSGIVKPRELAHDAAIYRIAEYERTEIEAGGGRVTRVVLDAELKAMVYRAWDQASHGTRDAETKKQVAEAYGLPIVRGRIQFPDARLELERQDGTRDHGDLELATRHYHRAHLQAKVGFRLYVPHGDDLVARITDV